MSVKQIILSLDNQASIFSNCILDCIPHSIYDSGVPSNVHFIHLVPGGINLNVDDLAELIKKVSYGECNQITVVCKLTHVDEINSAVFGDRDYKSRLISNLQMRLKEEDDIEFNLLAYNPLIDNQDALISALLKIQLSDKTMLRLTLSGGLLYRTDTTGIFALYKEV